MPECRPERFGNGNSRHLYKERNLAERFRHKAKQLRALRPRYDKTDRNYRAFVLLASINLLLRQPVNSHDLAS